MKKLVLIVSLLTFINAFSQKAVTINDSLYTVIKYDTNRTYPFKDATPTTLSKEEIIDIEKIISKEIDEIRLRRKKYFDLFSQKKIKRRDENYVYRRQYIAVINKLGEKEVYINSFCGDGIYDINWRSKIQRFSDGGDCFLHIKVNVSKKIVTDFHVNSQG
ncbi:MAG: hypothetical protein V4548_05705 [Bacteroidota bacterium]